MGQRVAITGMTATAARIIGGVMRHHFLKMSKRFDYSLDLSHELWSALKSIDVVVIDEISMATAHLLAGMDNVLCVPFGERTIIVIGDLCQLPSVPLHRFGAVYHNCAMHVLVL